MRSQLPYRLAFLPDSEFDKDVFYCTLTKRVARSFCAKFLQEVLMKTVQVGSIIEGKKVIEIGEPWKSENWQMLPVKFQNGTYAILTWDEDQSPKAWIPDNPKAAETISGSLEMPRVQHGIGSDVIHVRGTDTTGKFLVKMFYNTKKLEHGRQDEIHRS